MKTTDVQPYMDRIDKVRNNNGLQHVVRQTLVNNIVNEMIKRCDRTFIHNGYRAVQFRDRSGAIIGPDPNNPGETAIVAGDKDRMQNIVRQLTRGGK